MVVEHPDRALLVASLDAVEDALMVAVCFPQ